MMMVVVVTMMMMDDNDDVSGSCLHSGSNPKSHTAFQFLLNPYIHWLPNTQRLQASVVRHKNLHLINPTG